jgi:hypothetical protein
VTLATTIKGLLTKDDCLSDVVWEVTFKMFLWRRSCDISSNNNGGLTNTNEALFLDVYEASILSFKDDKSFFFKTKNMIPSDESLQRRFT